MAIDKTKNTQVLVTFPNDVLEEVEQYWHKNQFKNRNEAIRQLIKLGLVKSKSQSE